MFIIFYYSAEVMNFRDFVGHGDSEFLCFSLDSMLFMSFCRLVDRTTLLTNELDKMRKNIHEKLTLKGVIEG